jgi:hypothetical protein
MGFIGRKPTNAPLTSDDIPNGIIGAADLAAGLSKLTWQSTIVTTSTLSAVANEGYWIDTTSNACTITLPASASVGDQIIFTDYARNWGTNAITINLNGLNYQGGTDNPVYDTNGQTVNIVYSGATNGWIPISDDDVADEGTLPAYSADFLVIAGGGGGGNDVPNYAGGGGGAGGYRNSFSTEASGGGGSSEASLTFNSGTVYTVTVGAGGAVTTNGVDSSISGSDITTITSIGGGAGKANSSGASGGSGGGAGEAGTGGAGTANQGYAGATGYIGNPWVGGGGGGASAVGQSSNGSSTKANGGDGLASSITGSSISRGGGGGGGDSGHGATVFGDGGTGGGGRGTISGTDAAVAGTVNTGGGGGGGFGTAPSPAKAGGSGVVILSMPLANFSGTVTGSPTESDDGTTKRLIFNDSGSYTG